MWVITHLDALGSPFVFVSFPFCGSVLLSLFDAIQDHLEPGGNREFGNGFGMGPRNIGSNMG